MHSFLQKHAAVVSGILSGFDRLVFRGTLRRLAFAEGLALYLGVRHILLKDAGAHFEAVSGQVKAALTAHAEAAGRPLLYLPSARESKEAIALRIAGREKIEDVQEA
jgi:hypothetical protein